MYYNHSQSKLTNQIDSQTTFTGTYSPNTPNNLLTNITNKLLIHKHHYQPKNLPNYSSKKQTHFFKESWAKTKNPLNSIA